MNERVRRWLVSKVIVYVYVGVNGVVPYIEQMLSREIFLVSTGMACLCCFDRDKEGIVADVTVGYRE